MKSKHRELVADNVLSLSEIRTIARMHGYVETDYNTASRLVSFRGEQSDGSSCRLNVYYTTGTVGTCLDHPRLGKTQLFRKYIFTAGLMADIFKNPRLHTNKGCHIDYYIRDSAQESLDKCFDKQTTCLALGNNWVVGLYEDASFKFGMSSFWSGGATGPVYNRLN
jgi:hypothetical protein